MDFTGLLESGGQAKDRCFVSHPWRGEPPDLLRHEIER